MMFVISRDDKWVYVFTGGRTLNENEESSWITSVESNFYCQLDNQFSPFIHLFNGSENHENSEEISSYSKIEICSAIDNTLIHCIPYIPPLLPYSSSLIRLSDLLTQNSIHIDDNLQFYLRVHILSRGIFPRLICGNLHKDTNFPFITHSFKCYDVDNCNDLQEPLDKNDISMIFPICCAPPLDLQIRSYPTNQPIVVEAKQEDQCTKSISDFKFKTGSQAAGVQIFDSKTTLLLRHMEEPNRLNCSLNYSISNSCIPQILQPVSNVSIVLPSIRIGVMGFIQPL